ncbi:hypothetical protein QCA50_013625 [Cerrena zonata]|uniref:Uncharacterized protein n=1 Tax=Cerrena zonata TaxID=2478898 RepID=A0AAW0FNU7_9APHY
MAPMVWRTPNGTRTARDKVRIVVLGGSSVGVYTIERFVVKFIINKVYMLTKYPSCPTNLFSVFEYTSKCFPIVVHCRSPAEANAVWRLQSFVRTLERKTGVNEITFALLTDHTICALFGESVPGVVEFYTALFNKAQRPTIFLSWDDAYPYIVGYDQAKIAETSTFVDAMVYLCVRPRTTAKMDEIIHYERPSEKASEPSTMSGSQRMNNSELSEASTLTSNSVACQNASHHASGALQSPSTSTDPARGRLTHDHGRTYVHARNIYGHIVKSFKDRPSTSISVLSLGQLADRLADTLGHTTSTILRLHQTHLDAHQLSTPERYFVDTMVSHGMPYVDAVLYWDMMRLTPSRGFEFRERMSLDIE